MAHKVGIYYDQSLSGLQGIMSSHQIEEMERSIMMQKKESNRSCFFARIWIPGGL